MATKAVIYWPDTEQVSVVSLALLNEEDRYQDAVTTIKCGTKYHKAVVKLISSDERVLQYKADQVAEEIEEKEKQRTEAELAKEGRGKRSKKAVTVTGSASANQLASALGERLKATPQQAGKVKKLSEAQKGAEKARREAQDDVDRRALVHTNSAPSSSVEAQGSAEPDVAAPSTSATRGSVSKQLFDVDDDGDGSEDENHEIIEESDCNFSDDNEGNEVEQENYEKCCDHCKSLRKSYYQSGALFVQALGKYVNMTAGVGVQYAEPLDIPAEVPKVEISRKSKVYITVADKTTIKADGGGDPAKMTRMVLVALFGRSALEENAITAKGQKSGTLGIRKHVRAAIRAFVNRNKGPTYSDLTEANFNRVINRKKNQVHRSLLKKTPQPQKKKTKSPKKTPKPQTPQQKTPTPKETDQAPERRPMSSIRSSPFNEQEVQSGPPVRSMASIMGSPLDERMQRTPNSVVASPSKHQWSVTSYQMPPSQQMLPSHQMPPSHDYSSYQGLTGFNYTSQGEERPNQYSDQFSSQFSNQFSQYSTGNSNWLV